MLAFSSLKGVEKKMTKKILQECNQAEFFLDKNYVDTRVRRRRTRIMISLQNYVIFEDELKEIKEGTKSNGSIFKCEKSGVFE